MTTKTVIRTFMALMLGVATLAVTVVPADASHQTCRVTWGSLERVQDYETTDLPWLVDVRAGSHRCFDRVVLDLEGLPTDFRVAYVDEVLAPGSGDALNLDGGAALSILVAAPAYDANTGTPTYEPADDYEIAEVDGFSTLRQVAFAGSFEGSSTVGVGVRARLPFRSWVLDGPGDQVRLVVDIAHRW